MKKRNLKTLGIVSILIGFLFILSASFAVITGNVVSKKIDAPDSIAGIMFLIGGLALFLVGELESKIYVYDASKGKSRENEKFYHMTDPERYFHFSRVGDVSLNEFKRGVKEIENDEELIGLVRREYGPQLMKIEHIGSSLEKEIAKKFLDVLYAGKAHEEKKEELISKTEISEIRRAFDPGWTGHPNTAQARVLKEYGFVYEARPGHGKIYPLKNPNIKSTVSSTPSDINTGKNVAMGIIGMMKKLREKG